MGTPVIPVAYRFTEAEILAGAADSLSGVRITIVDNSNQPTGKVYESGPSGSAPTEAVTGSNINTVLSAAGGAGWVKSQATTPNYAITRPATGAGLDLHIEAGGSLASLNSTAWPVPASGVDQLRIRNFSGSAKVFTAGTVWQIVTADGNPVTGGSYSIPDDRAVEITLDPDGFAQVVPWGGEVSEAVFNAHTGNVSNPHGVTKTQVGLGSAENTADSAKPVSTAQQTALNLKQDAATAATDAELTAHTGNVSNPHGVTKTQVQLGNADNTSDLNKPVSTAQQAALDAKQAMLNSGNIKTVNNTSLLGSGNITTSADLDGGVSNTATNDGIATTGTPGIDTTTVQGETIIRWTGAGSFTVPVGVTNVRALLVGGGGGGGGGEGVSAGDGGGGGGAGELLDQSSFVVIPGATLALSVGGGGAGANSLGGQTGTNGTNGTNSTFGTLTARGGGGGGGNDLAANAGGSGGGGGGRCSSGIDLTGGASTAVSPGIGFAGGAGTGVCTNRDGAGGGGAGGVGGSSSGTGSAGIAGTGGAAVTSNITGAVVTYAGGGGGGIGGGQGTVGAGGSANAVTVGGAGGAADSAGSVGAVNTGSGGGGGGARTGEGQPSGGAGGSGVVIIRFTTQTRVYKALASYADNAAAIAGLLRVGQFYKNSSTNAVQQVF